MSALLNLTDFIRFIESELILSEGEVKAESNLRSLRTWGSLNALILISRINEETGLFISAGDLASCQTVTDLHNLIVTKSNGTD